MIGKKAQVGIEYIIVTAFILIVVTIIFAYSFVTQDEAIKNQQVNTALDIMVNKADYVYALGQGNSQLAWITIPGNVEEITLVHKCMDGAQKEGPANRCNDNGGVNFSAVKITTSFGAQTDITRSAKGPLDFVPDVHGKAFPCTQDSVFCEGRYGIKVYWEEGQEEVFLQRVEVNV